MPDLTASGNWSYSNPVHIISGAGVLNEWVRYVPETEKILLVTIPGFTQSGMTEKVKSQISSERIVVYDKVTPNPELEDLDAISLQYQNENISGIVALGGGSVIDTAKALSVTLPSKMINPLKQVLRDGIDHVWSQRVPVLAIPTTSGTGSEVTPFATVWDNPTHKKYSVTGDLVFPTVALLDPEITLTLPEKQTLYTSLDAISHALESLWNKNRSPVSEAFSFQALELATESLPVIMEDPGNIEFRAKMQQASLLAGLAISQTRTAIAHSISYPITSHFGVPHGLACSFTLPIILRDHLGELSRNNRERQIFEKTLKLLNSLNLNKEILSYANIEELRNLKSEMYTKGRADNFLYDSESVNSLFEIFDS